jgi:signal transduction histidine kinase
VEPKPKIKVLFIDDEENNLNAFKASFRFDYNILLASGAAEALQLLEANKDIVVILSDQRMPNKTGVELFEEIRQKNPYPIRILITGFTDVEAVIDAINRGQIFRYIKKPWNDVDIKSAIEEAHKFYLVSSTLSRKNEELKKAYNELDKFAYSVTHDLRGPIVSVNGAIELVQQEQDQTRIHYLLGLMSKSLDKLKHFIDNTHDYYKINRGELKIDVIQFDSLIEDMKDIYALSVDINKINFVANLKQSVPFRSDEMSIRLIVNNLLSNAFKYQKKDGTEKVVTLSIEVHPDSAEIIVSDNGIGIQEAYIQNIFNMFYRATSQEFGSGFGLYNVKEALMKVGGDITVDSRYGEGTTFKVIIPAK